LIPLLLLSVKLLPLPMLALKERRKKKNFFFLSAKSSCSVQKNGREQSYLLFLSFLPFQNKKLSHIKTEKILFLLFFLKRNIEEQINF